MLTCLPHDCLQPRWLLSPTKFYVQRYSQSLRRTCWETNLKMGSPTPKLDDEAVHDQLQTSTRVTYNGKEYDVAREGFAEILNLCRSEDSKTSTKKEPKAQSVFYNPIQQYNRDLSVLAIKAFGEDFAAVRKARHQRRIEELAKRERRGNKKRKRPHDNGEQDGKALDSGADVNGNYDKRVCGVGETLAPVTGEGGSVPDTVIRDPHLTGVDASAKQPESQDISEETNATVAEDQVKEAPRGPRATNSDATPATQSPFRILDALSATGLRALRYAREIPMVTSITANDLSATATASIRLNVEHNALKDKIVPTTSDAIEHMHYVASHRERLQNLYQVIDLDPYGTAAPFLDAAVQALADGGMLCVTCTDAGVFASVGYLEKTYSQYGGLPLKGPHAHEAGLRLILHAIATSAARYGLAIEPLLSLSIDFYARVFVRIRRSAAEVKFLASKTMVVYSCDTGCGAWSVQHLARPNKKENRNGQAIYTFTSALAPTTGTNCEHCGFRTRLAGPMWGGPLHNPHFIQCILDMLPSLDKSVYGTIPRIEGMLNLALDESLEDEHAPKSDPKAERPIPPVDPAVRCHHPFFFLPSSLSKALHCVSPSDAAMRGALMHLGYRTTKSHTKAGSICTDASWSVIWEVMREWVRQKSPVKLGVVKERTAGWGIMQKDRSKTVLNDAKEILSQAADSSNNSLQDLRKDMKAALYRLSKMEEKQGTTTHSETGQDGDKETVTDSTGRAETACNLEKETTSHEVDGPNSQPRGSSPERGGVPPSKLNIVFDEKLGRKPQGKRMVGYQANPRPDWGPMNRAKGGT